MRQLPGTLGIEVGCTYGAQPCHWRVCAVSDASDWRPEFLGGGPDHEGCRGSAPVGAPDPILGAVGDISFSQYWIVSPSGSFPIQGSRWVVREHVSESEGIPAWAIIMAIVFALLCLIGLLFLLVKERKTAGFVEVEVQGVGFLHSCQIRISNQDQVADVNARVGYARSLAASA